MSWRWQANRLTPSWNSTSRDRWRRTPFPWSTFVGSVVRHANQGTSVLTTLRSGSSNRISTLFLQKRQIPLKLIHYSIRELATGSPSENCPILSLLWDGSDISWGSSAAHIKEASGRTPSGQGLEIFRPN